MKDLIERIQKERQQAAEQKKKYWQERKAKATVKAQEAFERTGARRALEKLNEQMKLGGKIEEKIIVASEGIFGFRRGDQIREVFKIFDLELFENGQIAEFYDGTLVIQNDYDSFMCEMLVKTNVVYRLQLKWGEGKDVHFLFLYDVDDKGDVLAINLRQYIRTGWSSDPAKARFNRYFYLKSPFTENVIHFIEELVAKAYLDRQTVHYESGCLR